MGDFFAGLAAGVERLNGAVYNVVWGLPMIALILGTGIYFSIRTRFFQVIYARIISRETFMAIFRRRGVRKTGDRRAISQFQALSTALAATIGTGNIAGVATAITVGGPGAVFWMWVSAFFGMMTGYAESVLGIYFRRKNDRGEWAGGAMYYIREGLAKKRGLKRAAKPLSMLFALFCVLASFGIGNMSQVNSISSALESSFGVPPLASGAALAVMAGLVILGGAKRIGSVTEKLVPLMSAAYIAATLIILFSNLEQAPRVFGGIFRGAFGADAVAGGISGALLKRALSMGFKRGVFSNEAGLGSAVMIHAASDVKEPVIQGMWGIFEVFFDTIVMCSLTAFAILATDVVGSVDAAGEAVQGVPLVQLAFSQVFGAWAGPILAAAVTMFAFATVLGWSFYGATALEYALGRRATAAYKAVFLCVLVAGATMELQLAWDISDTLNGLMALPNLIGILCLSGTVVKITDNYIARRISGKQPEIEPMISAYPDIQARQASALRAERDAEN